MAGSAGDVPFVYMTESMCRGDSPFDFAFVERASHNFPKNHYFPLVLGLTFAEEKQYQKAVEQLEEAEKRAMQYCQSFPDSLSAEKALMEIRTDPRDARELACHLPS